MITKDYLEGYIKGNFRATDILDRICSYRKVEEIQWHDNNARNVFAGFYQYNDGHTIRIDEGETLFKKQRRKLDTSEEDFDKISIKNQIFDKHITLRLQSITTIELDNCVFEKGLSVQSLENEPLSVSIACCIIRSGINLSRISNYKEFSASYSFIESASFGDVSYEEISIAYSEIPIIHMNMCEIKSFSTIKAHLNLIFCTKSIIQNNSISKDSFDTYEVLKCITPGLFLKVLPKDNKNPNTERVRNARNDLLNFIFLLSNSDDLRFETEINAKLNYSYHKYKNKLPTRVFLYPVGYFYKPTRVIFTSVIVVVLFGFAYKFIAGTKGSLKLFECVYFSGITFFTIGYSDILDGLTEKRAILKEMLVLIEAGLGISLCSSLLASLLNKYINK